MERKLDEADKPILLRSTVAGENLTVPQNQIAKLQM
jgi:hypothetical protein